MIAVLATLPTTTALASTGPSLPGAGQAKRPSPSLRQLITPGELLSAGELQKLLSKLPLNDLSSTQLAKYLAGLEGISALGDLKLGLLSHEELGEAGLEESLRKAIEQLGPSAKLGELAEVENFLPALETALEGKLGGLLSVLLGALGAEAGLESALGSLSLEQLVGTLLESTTPHEQLAGELSGLAGGLFGELGAEHKLEGLLGSSELTGGFTPKSVQEVAEELKTTPLAVSEELGQTATQLPASATMLTAPLKDGKLAGIAPAVKGLVTGVLGNLGETPEGEGEEGGGKGGSGEGTGSGEGKGSGSGSGEGGKGSGSGEGNGGSGESKGAGGSGGTGAGGSAGSTTVLFTVPSTSTTPSSAPSTKQQMAKVAILGHRVRGDVATVVLRIPSAGTATLAGKGVSGTSKQVARAERLTLRVGLSRAALASLHHHHRLVVKLRASFRSASGSSSSAAATVVFR
ncbi:MAG: hypothetical protein ABSH36_05610 [Solirubrobacteraceae bacterium]